MYIDKFICIQNGPCRAKTYMYVCLILWRITSAYGQFKATVHMLTAHPNLLNSAKDREMQFRVKMKGKSCFKGRFWSGSDTAVANRALLPPAGQNQNSFTGHHSSQANLMLSRRKIKNEF